MPKKAQLVLAAAVVELIAFVVFRATIDPRGLDGTGLVHVAFRVALALGFWRGSEGARLILLFFAVFGLLLNGLMLAGAGALASPFLAAVAIFGLIICGAYLWGLNDAEVQQWMLNKSLGGALGDDGHESDDPYAR